MRSKTLDECMEVPWTPIVEELPDGGVSLRLAQLSDFEVSAASREQVLQDWKTALREHLRGSFAVGKVVPVPRLYVPDPPEVETPS